MPLIISVWVIHLFVIHKACATSISITLTPATAELTSKSPQKTSIVCALSSSTTMTNFYSMKILRKSQRETEFVAIAQVKLNAPQSPEIPSGAPGDVRNRNANVTKGIDTEAYTRSQLKIEFDTADIVCVDEGEYKCTVAYDNANGVTIIDEANATLTVYVPSSNQSSSSSPALGLVPVLVYFSGSILFR